MKFFRSGSGGTETAAAEPAMQPTRRSSGLAELTRRWETEETLCVLDLGSASPGNIRLFTGLGHRICSEDLLTASTKPNLLTKDEQGSVILDSRQFLADNLVYLAANFDVVLCWNLPDDLQESQVGER